ncbi:ABC transporter ATP-binding protein [Shewanella sp. JM162201]|uniref:ABC transporter ATP-binding protein n=1 Tax=Shewanella jiangmenensis TaxID=2837387 RepID=A0ABS5V5L1_9GAMM|nr:ABC transporter ATP-binding protein [Shewanella jiangmenensis]MBT1445112.1 ABC transporter ATP-binding protein [Shewanella jiangmenensis]
MDMTLEGPLLAVRGLKKRFGDKLALDGIDLTLEPGMVMGLLGENGAGKSTLMRTILGLLAADEGEVLTLGQSSDVLDKQHKTRIGYVPQQHFGYEGFSVERALALHSGFYPDWDKALEQSWLTRFGLDAKAQVNRLSLGQRQSLAIIMAMAYRPSLLILDEPVASLDPSARRRFMGDLFELALESGSAVLFSSHITSDLERVASHVALLKDGKLLICSELDGVRESVRLLNLAPGTKLPPTLKILGRQGNRVVVDGYQNEQFEGLLAAEPLNLEQLFMELHP